MCQNLSFQIFAITSDKAKFQKRFTSYTNLQVVSKDDFRFLSPSCEEIWCIIHCAFARNYRSNSEIAQSLNFSHDIMRFAQDHSTRAIINISSQGVYGQTNRPPWTERTSAAPDSIYAMAKYASELIFNVACISIPGKPSVTHLRLASLTGGQEGLVPEVISKFVLKALKGETIHITGGQQILSYLDVRDAASAVNALLSTDPAKWGSIYNVGNLSSYNIIEIACIIKEVAETYGINNVRIEIEQKDVFLEAALDSNLFYKDTGWQPAYDMTAIINSLFKYYLGSRDILRLHQL